MPWRGSNEKKKNIPSSHVYVLHEKEKEGRWVSLFFTKKKRMKISRKKKKRKLLPISVFRTLPISLTVIAWRVSLSLSSSRSSTFHNIGISCDVMAFHSHLQCSLAAIESERKFFFFSKFFFSSFLCFSQKKGGYKHTNT